MLFVTHQIDKRFFSKLLKVALSLKGSKIVFWMYPDTSDKTMLERFRPFLLGRHKLEVVTRYRDDNEETRRVDCYGFNRDLMNLFMKDYDKYADNLESIAFYRKGEWKWFLCSIFHENMTLFKISKVAQKNLGSHKISYSESPPDWW